MNPLLKIRNSFSFRSGPVYKNLFLHLPVLPINEPSNVNNRFRYLTFVGREQLGMLRASLWSLRQVVHQVPPMIIACDPGLDESALSRAMKWWRGPLQIWTSQEIFRFSNRFLPAQIASFCKTHVFGLKLAAVMRAGLAGWTIYADTDVLWFRDPESLLPKSRSDDALWLQLQQDCQMYYDSRLVELWPFLEQHPYCCAGVIVLNGDLRSVYSSITPALLGEILDSPMHDTEQTIMAAMQKTIGTACLEAEFAYHSWEHQFQLGPTCFNRAWVLRHYVKPVRHLFWRDVFYLYARRVCTGRRPRVA